MMQVDILGESFERVSYKSDDEENSDGEIIFEIRQAINPTERIQLDLDK